MKLPKMCRTIGVIVLTICFCCTAGYSKTKIAFIGNSITYGAGIANRDKNSVPAQLQAYLGNAYEVTNFGVSGRTLLTKGDLPYIRTEEYARSLDYMPDIVLIMLGTNDAKPQNRLHFEDFTNDYKALIDSYQKLASNPRIILVTPIRCFLQKEDGIDSTFITNHIVPAIKETAYDSDLEIIDLHDLFGDEWQSELMPDRLHPSSIGAGIMAQAIGRYLILDLPVNIRVPVFAENGRKFNFHGYKGYDFTLDGIDCKIIVPRRLAKETPCVLRTRFCEFEPQTDIRLLENGFHVVCCDVTDSYDSLKTFKSLSGLDEIMTQNGFNIIAHLRPYSFDNLSFVVDSILEATVGRENECIHPVPGNEYRSAAGWVQGNEWHSVADDIQHTLERRKIDLLLLGNSITQGWGGTRNAVSYKPGKSVMDELAPDLQWESAGISGDRTQNLLWRLQNYNYNVCSPRYVVIAIGVNNLIAGNSASDTAEGIIRVAEEAERVFPESDILLLGLYPSGKEKGCDRRKQCERIHKLLAAHKFMRTQYFDPTSWFTDNEGNLRDVLYSGDYIHFTPDGYRVATENILRLISIP